MSYCIDFIGFTGCIDFTAGESGESSISSTSITSSTSNTAGRIELYMGLVQAGTGLVQALVQGLTS